VLLTSTGGVAQGSFMDSEVAFHGVNSIVGRSVVIHGNAAS